MKKHLLLILNCMLSLLSYAITVESTIDGLTYAIKNKSIHLDSIDSLTVTGSISEVDFQTMKNEMATLKFIDLSKVSIYEDTYPSEEIPESAFNNNTNISTIILPSSTRYIGKSAFEGCSRLKSISIPSSVIEIDWYAFKGCTNLSSIRINNSTPIDLSYAIDVFHGINKSTCTLYVPNGSKELYQKAEQWKDFDKIIDKASINTFNTNNERIRISIKKGLATISGYSENEKITIYDIYGKIFYHRKAEGSILIINFPNHGTYLLNTESQIIKFLVK